MKPKRNLYINLSRQTPPSASHMATDRHADETRQHKPNVHSILSFRTHFTALHSPEAGWQMSAAFTRSRSAPSCCLSLAYVTPALTSRVMSHRISEGIPVARQTLGAFSERRDRMPPSCAQWQRNLLFLETVNAYWRTPTLDHSYRCSGTTMGTAISVHWLEDAFSELYLEERYHTGDD